MINDAVEPQEEQPQPEIELSTIIRRVEELERKVGQLVSRRVDDAKKIEGDFSEVADRLAKQSDRVFMLEYAVKALKRRKWWQVWK